MNVKFKWKLLKKNSKRKENKFAKIILNSLKEFLKIVLCSKSLFNNFQTKSVTKYHKSSGKRKKQYSKYTLNYSGSVWKWNQRHDQNYSVI